MRVSCRDCMQSGAKVAIIGGGCASLAAAWSLSSPRHAGRYAITVYQLGFRCGGKGASGRGHADRIEEHGLHLWLGFYENAFAMVREVYEELARDPERCRIAHWWQALVPDPNVSVADRERSGSWGTWLACFPPGEGLPGDAVLAGKRGDPFTVRRYMTRAAALVVELLRSVARDHEAEPGPVRPAETPSWLATPSVKDTLESNIEALLGYGKLASLTAIIEAASLLAGALERLGPLAPTPVLRLIDLLVGGARKQLELVLANDELRRVWIVVDLVLACIRGSVRHGLLLDARGFDAINDYDWIEWLRLNGASDTSLSSGFMQAIYDLTFAYAEGDPAKPALAAGVAMRGATRMFFSYRGALFWKMTSGMGDVIFAPLYEALRRRGVRFEFFHELTRVGLGEDRHGPHVATLEFAVQAELREAEYRPLVDVRGLPCWPALPDYEQLVDGELHRSEGRTFEEHGVRHLHASKTLHVGHDFDYVVLGVPLAAIPTTCAEILARDERWRAMVRHCKTVATQAVQLWMREDMAALGWAGAPTNLSGYVRPFATWADMRQLIVEESHDPAPRAIAYLCCVMPDPPARPDLAAWAREAVRANAIHYLERDVGVLWPGALDSDGRFRWSILLDPRDAGSEPRSGPERIDAQYMIANVEGAARYSQSVPGSIAHRISPLDNTYDNLTIAGDWTASGLDSGCVESAVMSGLLAAHAISQFPKLEDIIGYDHP